MAKEKQCKIVFGFNDLGMIIFACETHGKLNSKYQRLPVKCRQKVIKVFEELFWEEMKTGAEIQPIELSKLGEKIFRGLIGRKAYEVKSGHRLGSPNLIRVKIVGEKTIRTMSKDFWQ